MCRPGHGPSRHPFTGGHIGPPLHGAESVPGPTEIGARNDASPSGAGRSPPPTEGAEQGGLQRGAPRVWLPPAKFRNGIWGVSHGHPALRKQHWWCLAVGRCGHRPLRREGEVPATTQASGAQRSVCAAVARKWVGIAAEIIPKGTSNAGQSLSHGLRPCQLPLHKGALGDGGCGSPRRFAPRNDSPDSLSFRGGPTGRRGNPSFYDGRGFGPPYLGHGLRRPNFVPKFGASVRSSAPTESPINHPSQPVRSEASAPAAARDGRESAQRPSQKGDRPATARAALSESESAERGAGQIRSLPDD